MLVTTALLVLSNVFMTFAWYYHLKKETAWPLWLAIAVSWGIAFFEYCLQVPANRAGHRVFNITQLKILQEAITLCVFVVFAKLFFGGEKFKWNYAVGMLLVMLAVVVVFVDWSKFSKPQVQRQALAPADRTTEQASARQLHR